jgi:hypothetical protein
MDEDNTLCDACWPTSTDVQSRPSSQLSPVSIVCQPTIVSFLYPLHSQQHPSNERSFCCMSTNIILKKPPRHTPFQNIPFICCPKCTDNQKQDRSPSQTQTLFCFWISNCVHYTRQMKHMAIEPFCASFGKENSFQKELNF